MWTARAAIAAVGLAAWLAYLSGGALGIGTSDRDYLFSPADSPWAQSMLPALDTPFAAPWTPSALAGRASMAIALGRRTALRDFAAATSALAIVAFGFWLSGAGVPRYSVLITMFAMGASSTSWWRGVHWTPDALSPALALLAAWAGWRWLHKPHPIMAGTAALSAALALAEDPAWLACLPGVVALVWSRLRSHAHRLGALAVIAAAGACAVLPVLARAAVARSLSWPSLVEVEPLGAIALWIQPAMGIHGSSPGATAGVLSTEFTPLGALLVMIGLVVLWRVPSGRRPLAALVAGLIGWLWFVPRSGLEVASVPLAICGWAAVAVALAWLEQAVPRRASRALVAVLSLLMVADPTLTRVRLAALGQDDQSEAQARMAYGFNVRHLPPDTALIAESRRVDAAILLSLQQAGRSTLIVPQTVEHLQSVSERGRTLVAFANGRSHLERVGFLFERSWVGETEVAVLAGQVPCVDLRPGEWPDVSLLVATGSFILYGAEPASAPGGVILRLTDPQPVRPAGIDPRSIPFEFGPTVHDAAVGMAELDQAAARTGVWQVWTLRIRETGRPSPVTFTFAAGAPHAVVATADGPSPVRLCPGIARRDFTLGRAQTASAVLPLAAFAPFGPGWHSPEADPDPFRWTAASNASVRVSMASPGPVHVTVTAWPAARPAHRPTIALAVNGCQFPARPMTPGHVDYEWAVEEACWRAGINQLWLGSDPLVSPASLVGGHDTRQLGARIGALRLARIPRPAARTNAAVRGLSTRSR